MKSALMLGVNPLAEREINDFYATEPKAMEIALPYLQEIGKYNLFLSPKSRPRLWGQIFSRVFLNNKVSFPCSHHLSFNVFHTFYI